MALKVKDGFLSERQVADCLGCSVRGLRELRCKGSGPVVYRIGSRKLIRYHSADLLKWLAGRVEQPKPVERAGS